MHASVHACALMGIEGQLVHVECLIAGGLPGMHVVGLGDTALMESKERVRAALKHSGFAMPPSRVSVNLAPAHLRKVGPAYDLAIAAAILVAAGRLPQRMLEGTMLLGELALDGRLRPVPGALAAARTALRAGIERVVVPPDNASEARLVEGVRILAPEDLRALVEALRHPERGGGEAPNPPPTPPPPALHPDLSELRGQRRGRRGLEIAIAGGHALLLVGPPGSGKTMLAQRAPSILPPLAGEEAWHATLIRSALGEPVESLIEQPPFRAPHPKGSAHGLLGGGPSLLPGEVTRAHGGVLFLDELAEWSRDALEGLRTPLEDGVVDLIRVGGQRRYPARFALIGAMNPCPCGFWGDEEQACRCHPRDRQRYQGRISGPLLDRFDLRVVMQRSTPAELLSTAGEVDAPPAAAPAEAAATESSATVATRVRAARELALARQGCLNGQLSGADLDRHAPLSESARQLLGRALSDGALSARGGVRVRRVARTIADLRRDQDIAPEHLAEALGYRRSPFSG